jgi:MYXO-CTERM domain-containing protein
MPSGIGIATNGRTSAHAGVLGDLRVHNGSSGLIDGAVTGVARVAAASGDPIRIPPKTNASTSSADRLTIVAVALGLAAVFAAFRLRRRESQVPRSIEKP